MKSKSKLKRNINNTKKTIFINGPGDPTQMYAVTKPKIAPLLFFEYLSTFSIWFSGSNQPSTHEPKKDELITNPGKGFKPRKLQN